MKTFMFPGQGSQTKGMGGSLFDEFAEQAESASAILGYSIKELCLDDPRSELGKTQFTQPALFVVNALSYLKQTRDAGRTPDFLAGHSLGEFNALLAAECFDFDVGLKLVQKRGELMSRVSNGSMAAVLNASKQEIETILADNGLQNIDLANYNSPSQIVISGARDEIQRAQAFFEKGRMRYYPLNTSGAFHSRFMQSAAQDFRAHLAQVQFSRLRIPVISNVTARPYQTDDVADTLAKQIVSTVRWSESIQYLMDLNPGAPMEFQEIGQGDVLTRIVRTIKQLAPKPVPSSTVVVDAATAGTQDNRPDVRIEAPKARVSAAKKVASWNERHPVGTRVKYVSSDYQNLETRTEALVLFGHRAAVYMRGLNGYFDLDEITAI